MRTKHLPIRDFARLLSLALLLHFATVACAQKNAAQNAPTWTHDIAPIIYKNCLSCHHTGGSAPFDLSTYAQAKRWAPQMLDVTQSRYMPPWLPAEGHGHFAGDRRMSASEIAAIKAWVNASAPEGSGPAPKAPAYTSSWSLGPPDLIVEMPAPIAVPASGTDLFMNFVLPVSLTKTRWVRAMEIKPGQAAANTASVTHHANLIIDRTQSVRRQHPADWQRGVPGMDILVDSGDDFDPDSHFLFWKPDSTALVEAPTMPWRLDPGNDLVLNMHLKPTGKPETLRARIGLYFTDKPATQRPMLLQLENDAALDIPAGDADFTVEDSLQLPVAVQVLGVYPHAHYLGKRLEAWADVPPSSGLPNGTRKDLILIPDWDIDRQSVYRLAEPLPLPAGTVLHMRYTYDNSAANIHNPHSPPVRVKAGNRSEDEMAHLWVQVLPEAVAPAANGDPPAPDPRLALERAWMENRLRKSPEDLIALYNLAALATAQGDNAQAESLYRRLLAHNPNDARTITSLGASLAAAGDWHSAQQQFHAALKLDPTYTDAAFDLAGIDLQHADQPNAVPEAEQLLTQLISAHPHDAASQRLLAMAYATDGQLAKALVPLHAWAGLEPMNPEPRRALAQVYGQMGQMPDALREQRAVVALSTGNSAQAASDWNDLGVMEARAGNPSAARRDFTHALELDPTLTAARNNLSKL